MKHLISDKELIAELEQRFKENRKSLEEQLKLMAELKTVNEKLIASEGLKSNFLSNIRNEINNPIASILELSKNISEGTINQDAMMKFAGLIYSESFSLDFQLRNIFASAEIEAGEAIVSPVFVDVDSVLENVLVSFKHLIEKKKIHISIDNSVRKHERFNTDAEKLHLILSNLIANAIQFNHEGGSIEINSEIKNAKLSISIMDNGQGMTESETKIIFDRFRQLEEGSTKSHGGHGLGLSISKALIELMNGEIIIESRKNEGSSFTLCINECMNNSEEEDVFSSDGNDFLFTENESISF